LAMVSGERVHARYAVLRPRGYIEDAKREFAPLGAAWLAKTGRDEEMYRPCYGSPLRN
jgi:hypothetical protein